MAIILNDNEFKTIQKLIFKEVGIDLQSSKKMLVQSRLLKRLLFYKLNSYLDYIRLIQINEQERIEMINLITTNETYFFREIEHFEYLQRVIIPNHPFKKKFRFWSAAASVGAEAYSVAMLLDKTMAKSDWEIVGTDINTKVIKKARVGLYPEKWVDKIPTELKKEYCLKGRGSHEGQFLIDRKLVENIDFRVGNLLKHNGDVGEFDVIFLRNVLIYFDDATKQLVVDNVLKNLKIGGYFVISLTENLNMVDTSPLENITSSIYKKIRK
ncbi:CheR family methyltransferase [Sulfurimonas autotrophica]|uniref:protein-glutamate O-methyltransferase n=1 Tax=Sulfurimonas autotrophica (strain ATCC BAA-671 / DSM 16294 / JCM 11897 / OK10) TaxID=563040 RepID=E0US01_SULAO|nr:protein-glutamate O-methyltransferase CheR [Sulfurimonas autotrophica]ADN09024.1 MCP methyltransferase, CheR-type [Sulfurimonas autotrophica DSM 16294]